jgi:cysteinyl-tRNA synthetase
VDVDAVMDIINKRANVRRKRNYHEADKLLDDLHKMGVNVDDKNMMWNIFTPVKPPI